MTMNPGGDDLFRKRGAMGSYGRQSTPSRERVVEQFLPRIKSIALGLLHTLPHNVELNDLVQEGVIALLNAYDRYDPSRGATFSTYSMKRIKGSMYDYLRNLDWLPRKTRHLIKVVEKAFLEMEGELRRPPTPEEIAQHTGLTDQEVRLANMEMNRRQLLRLDGYLQDVDSEGDYSDFFSSSDPTPEELYEKQEFRERLQNSILSLKEREQLVLSLYYIEELNFKEIGAILGVTESRISQIHSAIMLKLRERMRQQDP